MLVLPSVNDGESKDNWTTLEKDSTLKLTSVFDQDGLKVLGAFTSPEKLVKWIKKETEYTAIYYEYEEEKFVLIEPFEYLGEKIRACTIAKMAGADFVKTSTGFNKGGATIEDITLMRKVVGPLMGVKASGGVRDTETARAMIAAGATRIGTSSGINIIKGSKPATGTY